MTILTFFSVDGDSPAPICVTDPAAAWQAITKIEPELLALKREAKSCCGRSWHDYERLKAKLEKLVGWAASQPALQSSEAFNVAHRHVLGAW